MAKSGTWATQVEPQAAANFHGTDLHGTDLHVLTEKPSKTLSLDMLCSIY